jgi:putative addiction module antidote
VIVAAALKLIAMGDSVGFILPKEMLARLRVGTGDVLYVVETPSGIELTPYRPELARQLDLAEDVVRENHGVLGVRPEVKAALQESFVKFDGLYRALAKSGG